MMGAVEEMGTIKLYVKRRGYAAQRISRLVNFHIFDLKCRDLYQKEKVHACEGSRAASLSELKR